MALVQLDAAGPVATLTLDRPDARNALSVELCDEIVVALHRLGSRPDLRVLIVRGAGSVFCAGADVNTLTGPGAGGFVPAFEAMLDALTRFRLPTIAAIQGAALGGGYQLASVCDFAVAAADAKIGIPSARLGVLVNFENVQRLVLRVGPARSREGLMTARTYRGDEATAAGLVTGAVPAAELDAAVSELAAGIAAGAPLSVQGSKRAIQLVVDHLSAARAAAPDLVADMDRLVADVYASDDLAEGVRALSEKRDPRFRGH
ncbi:MAG: enoyl-CoA hydratase/isomerase family protein [Actinomycetota bacterium]